MRWSYLRRVGLLLLLALLPGCKGCNKGVSNAHEKPLPDGTVILLRGTNGYGAVILHNQRFSGGLPTPKETLEYKWSLILRNQRFNRVLQTPEETLEYEWFFRSDGQGTFATNDPKVLHGTVTKPAGTQWSKLITFQGFSVEWSGNTDGLGWVYYPHDFHTFNRSAAWSMCVTDRTNLEGINPGDWRWSYSTRPPFSLTQERNWLKGQLGSTPRGR